MLRVPTNIGDAISSVNNKIVNISVCAARMSGRKDIKSMYPQQVFWGSLPNIMTSTTWGCMQFVDSHRAIKNFLRSQVIGFDFDSGLQTLDGIIEVLQDMEVPAHVGVTKSHQLPKGPDELVCDRFRVAILMESETTDADLYRQQMEAFKIVWATGGKCWFDQSCVDPARLFYPCTQIVKSTGGNPLGWISKKQRQKRAFIKPMRGDRDIRLVPGWVFDRITKHTDGKSRHTTCYAIGAELAGHNYELEEIVEFLMSGYLAEIGEHDVRECAYNGWSKTKDCYDRRQAIEFATAGGRISRRDSK